MAITDWPLAERPREKLLARGAGQLSDAELLALFFRTGRSGRTAVDQGREALAAFGSLQGVLAASQQEFCRLPGLGPSHFVLLQAARELAQRYLAARLRQGEVFTSPGVTRDYLHARLRDYRREVFLCLYLDNRHALLAEEELFLGTLDGAAVYPREVVRQCLHHNAAAIIVAHNHPSGVAEPSQADRRITDRLRQALGLVDIRVLDHFVVGDGEVVSFAERGWL